MTVFLLFLLQIALVFEGICHTDRKRILVDDPHFLQSQIDNLKHDLQIAKTQLSEIPALRKEIQNLTLQLSQISQNNRYPGGTLYIIWGKKTCPVRNSTTTVYSGISGGKAHDHSGSGVNTLCLPHNPDLKSFGMKSLRNEQGHLYGSEYQFTYQDVSLDDDIPCAVCHVEAASSVLMIPAKKDCPTSWTEQYSGFLTSEHFDFSLGEYLCMDENPEYLTEGARQNDYNGRLFYPVKTVCGSLPCPPYQNDKNVWCVLCTK